MASIGRARQTAVFLGGLGGARPRVPPEARALEAAALRRMGRNGGAYIAGGAGSERTMAANLEAFERRRIVPRMLRDVSARDLSVEVLGRRWTAPVGLAPIGVLDMAHPGADVAAARAAGALGLTFTISSQACRPMEEVAAAAGPSWFQLYWSIRDEVARSFVERAERAGCEAIVLTLDTTELGWRPRDLSGAYLPFLRGRGIANYASDPVFRALEEAVEAGARPRPGVGFARSVAELLRYRPAGLSVRETTQAVARFVGTYSRPDLVWEDVARLKGWTSLPVVLKGIVHPEDARLALEAGADGIVVSNHGGRQVDGSVGALEALPGVVEAVAGRVPVLFDSGVRSGADVAKALALGARAVLVGRPYAYGMALGGEAGAREVLENLVAEFDLTLGLSGRRAAAELDGSLFG